MPTTLTGLLLFVVLLLPGFAYLVGKERHGTERHASPFRETVAIVAASVTSEIFVLTIFWVVRWLWPSGTPDIGRLIRSPGGYLTGTQAAPSHYGIVGIWGLAALVAATIAAYAATVPSVRRAVRKVPVIGGYPHDSTVSGWWVLFEKWKGDRAIDVGCVLDDGSYVSGRLASFNTSADDSPDRELLLWPPILYRPPKAREPVVHETAGAASIAASRIVSLFVSYQDASVVIPPPVQPLRAAPALPAEEAVADPTGAARRPPPGQPSARAPTP